MGWINGKYNKLQRGTIKRKLDDIIKLSGEYNWHSEISMRFALDKIKNELNKLRGEL